MEMLVFIPTVLLEIAYAVLFVLTVRDAFLGAQGAGFRFWPPPSLISWQFFAAWIMAVIVAVNFLLLGLLNTESFMLPPFWIRLPAALALFTIGTAIGVWAFFSFGLRATLGLGGRLITGGPYRYSRNPQYISDSLNILAFIILTNAWMVAVIGALGILLNYLAPLTEESWLEKRYGTAYLEYKARVPRFIGLRIKRRARS